MSEKHKDEEWLRREINEKGRDYREVARELSRGDTTVSDSTVRSYASQFGINKPLEDEERIEKAIKDGLSIEDMAERWNEKTWDVRIALEQKGYIKHD